VVERSLTQTWHTDRQESLGRRELSLAEAITMAASAFNALVPAGIELLLLEALEGLLDPPGDQISDVLVDPTPENALACLRLTW
jgi:hypothetical protein